MKKQPLNTFRTSYRLQLHKDFRFQDAKDVVAYLARLGVSHLYLSPIMESMPGSNHGYDGTDPEKISLERGGEAEFIKLIKEVRSSDLEGLILDIVPNHLACNLKNPYWYDVLKNGKASKYWNTFDLKTTDPQKDPIILPVLGKSRLEVLNDGDIKVIKQGQEWQLMVYESLYPLNKAAQNILDAKRPSAKVLKQILESQYYCLEDWRQGSRKINYRRFFDINDLIGIRMEDPKVFSWFHKKTFELMNKHPEIQGLRIDHVDGLTFPRQYLSRLHRKTPHIWVEKILGEKESLPHYWSVLGSTGYEFSNVAARLFVYVPGLLYLDSHYLKNIEDRWHRFHDCVYDSKRQVLQSHFSSELKFITALFYEQVPRLLKKRFTDRHLSQVISEVTAALRVYRTYAQKKEPLQYHWLTEAIAEAEGKHTGDRHAFKWFRQVLEKKGDWPEGLFLAIKRWEQLSGPVMAKGLEDTALYRYCPLLSLNGVGGEPDWLGDAVTEYNSFQRLKHRQFPLSMNTSSTHDTKRSEDVLSRVHVLSELSEQWAHLYEEIVADKSLSKGLERRSIYFIAETVLGAWPMDGKITKDYVKRIQAYAIKASREAKLETSWLEVNTAYENRVKNFIEQILTPNSLEQRELFKKMKKFASVISFYGAFNSLGFLVLKTTSLGVADFYQGCEMWDLSLVDPDNRRPVDYDVRKEALERIQKEFKRSPSRLLIRVTKDWRSGEIKLLMTWRLLQMRNRFANVFLHGEYIPVPVRGKYQQQFVSYLRRYKDQWFWVVLPRFLTRVDHSEEAVRLDVDFFADTKFTLPAHAPRKWENILTKTSYDRETNKLDKMFAGGPVAVLRSL
ncbi:hypothetical protein AZI86_13345 [Bdellovibrio bacteriovorus]|uniref:Glycosyl hydrolase family 13 catalytic domain-containing protein n=1 Tax=Bdellovibrio bacteriovorus TaxID=959 RepID=A0A150WJK1_BDEBC|nr:malto-oligosyltrehalose synthase [Bdellovibrio bacteriovorus]KYG63803.1 hypothetical protein AZI86_13345 [Bdellovibrio bacteriovorus]